MYKTLRDHLFPGDGDEHGAVVEAGLMRTDGAYKLLKMEFGRCLDNSGAAVSPKLPEFRKRIPYETSCQINN